MHSWFLWFGIDFTASWNLWYQTEFQQVLFTIRKLRYRYYNRGTLNFRISGVTWKPVARRVMLTNEAWGTRHSVFATWRQSYNSVSATFDGICWTQGYTVQSMHPLYTLTSLPFSLSSHASESLVSFCIVPSQTQAVKAGPGPANH